MCISIGEARLQPASRMKMGARVAGRLAFNVSEYDRQGGTLTMSMSIAAPGLSAYMSSPHKLPLTLAAGVRVLMVIGSCVGGANANGMLSSS